MPLTCNGRGCEGCVGSCSAAPANSTESLDEPGAACSCYPANQSCPSAVACRRLCEQSSNGHPGYVALLDELRALHKTKSAGYGTGDDPMGNFTAVAHLAGQPRYLYPVHRTIEKLTRVLSLHASGRVGELEEEFLDGASLLLCAAAMLRDDM